MLSENHGRAGRTDRMNREAAEQYLAYLDPETEQFTFQTFTDSDTKKESYERNPHTKAIIDPLARVLHGTLDRHWATLVDLSRHGAGIFVTVNKTTLHGRRNNENITDVRAYCVDCDGVPQDEIKVAALALGLMPHIIVKSSDGKWHFYWCVDDAPLEGFGATQKRLAELFGSDQSVCDLARVMRLPGFPHQKDGSIGDLVQLAKTHDAVNYSEDEFQRALANALAAQRPRKMPERPTEATERAGPDQLRGAAPEYPRHREDRSIAAQLAQNLGTSRPDWSRGYAEGRRNIECAKRAASCLGRGMSEEETLAECLSWNNLNTPPLDDSEVRSVVASMARTHERNHSSAPELRILTPSALENSQFIFDGDIDLVPPRELIKGLVPASGVVFIGGQSSAGKTFIAIALGLALASGRDFLCTKSKTE
jgi:hypothetical protein